MARFKINYTCQEVRSKINCLQVLGEVVFFNEKFDLNEVIFFVLKKSERSLLAK